jgi:enterochelin esterase-like enzyme
VPKENADNMSELLSTRLHVLQKMMVVNRASALDHFWREIKQHGTPLIEPALPEQYYVTFLWHDDGTTRSVDVIQDWGADGIREHGMTHLQGTDIWYKTRLMPSDTRTTYQLAPDPLPPGHTGNVPFIPDPLNPKRFSPYRDENGFKIWFSSLVLPDAPSQPWLSAAVPAGTITQHTPFEDNRRIWVYVPDSLASPPYSLFVVLDGRLAIDILDLPEMLNLRMAEGRIRPTLALFIDNIDRKELQCVPEFAGYLAQRVVPWARSTFPLSHNPAHTVITGSSYGGLCAAYLGLRFPNIFGTVLSQTGWFRWHPDNDPEHEWLARQFINHPLQSVAFYLDVGILENARMVDNGPSQLVANRHMRDVLQAKGYKVIYREYSGGHDYSSLQDPLFDALPLMLSSNR